MTGAPNWHRHWKAPHVASKAALLWGGIAVLVIAGTAFVAFPQLSGQKAAKPSDVSAIAGGPTVLRRLTQTQRRLALTPWLRASTTYFSRVVAVSRRSWASASASSK